jgi:hypothetical protein
MPGASKEIMVNNRFRGFGMSGHHPTPSNSDGFRRHIPRPHRRPAIIALTFFEKRRFEVNTVQYGMFGYLFQ